MWYKEWLETRYKVIATIVAYLAIGVISFLSWIRLANYEDLATTWYTQTFFANIIIGAICGFNLVEGEKESISFLLTRPISRTKVYGSKILLNVAWFSGLYLLATFIIVTLSYLPFTLDRWDYTALVSRHDRPAPVMNLDHYLATGLMVWLIGLTSLCHTGFISVLQSKTQFIYMVSGLVFCALAAGFIITHGSLAILYSSSWVERPKIGFALSLILGVMALGFFKLGVHLFRRKQY